ncbi:MAG: EVE domain-containing protein [Burkholderiales bacterium]
MSRPIRNWIAVASAEHARRGRDHEPVGFIQVGHGKRAPLSRIAPGDRVAYYAPATTLVGKDKLQSFVSIGMVQVGEPYEFDVGGGFIPWRRDARYVPAQDAPIAPLLDAFEFIEDRKHWGAKFRFGLIEINDHDMRLMADAMSAESRALGW